MNQHFGDNKNPEARYIYNDGTIVDIEIKTQDFYMKTVPIRLLFNCLIESRYEKSTTIL